MIYDNHIPNNPINVQPFFSRGGTNDWHSWNKPHNCKFIHIFCLGSGGGGGSGQGSPTLTSRRGGHGGGAAAYVNALYTASFLPDTLYLQVAPGGSPGLGGTYSTGGGTGALSYVSIQPNTTAQNIIMQSGSGAAGGGAAGTLTGPVGSAGTVWAAAATNILLTGLIVPVAGQAGGLGQTTAPANDIAISGIVTGGAPGAGMNGGTSRQGGGILGTGSVPAVTGGEPGGTNLVTPTLPGGAGGSYYTVYPSTTTYAAKCLFFSGGSGGGSSDQGLGGEGGAGSFGSGGGGGGAGITNGGGNGGRGGDGLIIITCF